MHFRTSCGSLLFASRHCGVAFDASCAGENHQVVVHAEVRPRCIRICRVWPNIVRDHGLDRPRACWLHETCRNTDPPSTKRRTKQRTASPTRKFSRPSLLFVQLLLVSHGAGCRWREEVGGSNNSNSNSNRNRNRNSNSNSNSNNSNHPQIQPQTVFDHSRPGVQDSRDHLPLSSGQSGPADVPNLCFGSYRPWAAGGVSSLEPGHLASLCFRTCTSFRCWSRH